MNKLVLFLSCLLALMALGGVANAQGGKGKHAATASTAHPLEDDEARAPHEAKVPTHDAKALPDDEGDPKDGEATQPSVPVKMNVGIQLEKLTKFEVGPGTFVAEFYLTFTCASEPCKPDFEITNGKVSGKPDKVVDEKLVKEFRVKADLEGLVDLSEFPFDKHLLYIGLVDKNENVTYAVDDTKSQIDPDIKLAGWSIGDHFAVHTETHKLSDGHEVSEAELGIELSRPRVSSFFKSLVPVLFMVFVAGFTLILKPKSAAGRLSTATGGLMSVVMFHLSSTSSLPPMGYLTRLDKFMLATYLIYLTNIAFSVAMVRFEEKKKEKLSELAYLAAAGAVPGVALVAWVAVFMKLV
jgi:hypothetical protein